MKTSNKNTQDQLPRIYVACLASYNAGILHGAWIDCSSDIDSMHEAIAAMLKQSPEPDAEEWAIHDYENFGSYQLHEYTSIDTIAQLMELYEEHDELAWHVIGHVGDDYLDEVATMLTQRYAGCYDSATDWAIEFLSDSGQLESLPDNLQYYFDFEKYARDCEYSGDITVIHDSNNAHIFWGS